MKEEIKKRTKQIGLEVIKLIDDLPNKTSSKAIANLKSYIVQLQSYI